MVWGGWQLIHSNLGLVKGRNVHGDIELCGLVRVEGLLIGGGVAGYGG